MAVATNEQQTVRDKQIATNKPDSEINNQLIRNKIKFLEEYIRSQGVVVGAADADPITPNFNLVDTNPTTGVLTDIVIGQTLIIIDGRAATRKFKITGIDIPNDEIQVSENLFNEGVRSGDIYRVIYSPPDSENKSHSHDGIDSHLLQQPNLGIIFGFA